MGKIILIGASDDANGIGKNNSIPWHYPEDLRHFKRTTMGHTIIMGRKTWESMGSGELQGRTNIVLSETLPPGYHDGVFFYPSERVIFSIIEDSEDTFYVIGGQQMYERFLPHADEIILTDIPGDYGCDTFFPDFSRRDWEWTDTHEGAHVEFRYYKRK